MKQEKIKMKKKEPDKAPDLPAFWVEISDAVSHRFQFKPDGQLSVRSLLFPFLFFSLYVAR